MVLKCILGKSRTQGNQDGGNTREPRKVRPAVRSVVREGLPLGRPVILGCEGPTERITSFVDKLL